MSPPALPLLLILSAAPAPSPPPAPPSAPIAQAQLDPGVPACQDFYAHAVGGWLAANPVPADKGRYGAFEALGDRNQALLGTILTETSARRDWPAGSVEQQVGDFYAAGMDEAAIETAGTRPLRPWLRRLEALQRPAELPAWLADAHQHGLSGGIGFDVRPDAKDSTRYLLILHQAGLGLPDRDYYLRDDERSRALRARYVALVAELFQLAGQPADRARADAALVMALETRLARASRARAALRDAEANYNPRTLAQLTAEAPGFDWAAYLARLGVPPGQDLNVRQPEFARAFAEAARDEPLATWRAYLRWHLLVDTAPYLPRRFDAARFAFYGTALHGVPREEERWKRVASEIDDALGEALGRLYVARAFGPESRQRVLALVENLRAALRERIDALAWMSPETKDAARKKLAAFTVKIGYPDRWRDYGALTVKRRGYLDDVLAAQRFESRRILARLGGPVDRAEWGMSPPTVNAYYNQSMNEIVFPAGILQPPFFWADADDAVNYGAIGVVIGHEMTHGFDDQGAKYDALGNLHNWWAAPDWKAYTARADLMAEQFDGYRPLQDAAISGKLTLGENIADLGGLKIAWAGLQKALGGDPNGAPPLDGFTPGQRFFLAYAAVWANNIRDEELRARLTTDFHSPGKWRVDGPLSNLPEFHAAFACPDGSPMRRPEAARPEIW